MPKPRLLSHLPAEVDTLWTLFTAPAIWAGHFLACYAGAALACAKGWPLADIRFAVAVLTALALAGIGLAALLAWRQWGFGRFAPPHHEDSAHDRRRFQGYATLLLCGLSAVAVGFGALPAFLIAECGR
jgi:hypothetical protein